MDVFIGLLLLFLAVALLYALGSWYTRKEVNPRKLVASETRDPAVAPVAAVAGKPLTAKKGAWSFCPECGGSLQMGDADGKQRLKCTSCSFVHWDNPKAVSVLLIPKGDALVLVKRAIPPKIGMLALPGGFVDQGEDPWMGAIREAKEETGLDVEIESLYGRFSLPGVNQYLLFFLCKPVTQEPVASKEGSVHVLSPSEIPLNSIAFPSHREMIERWLKEQGKH